jgi:hypothetical protein
MDVIINNNDGYNGEVMYMVWNNYGYNGYENVS